MAAKESGDLSALDAPNAAYAEAKAGLVLVSISVEITWQTMHFTYTVTNQQWDPQTHDYTHGDEATWAANDNSNVIEITNNSTASVDVGFEFEAADGFDDISGQFYKDDALIENNILTMAEGTSESVTFNVTGSIPSSITDDIMNIERDTNRTEATADFVPPSFDFEAQKGMPTVPDGMGYLEIYKEGMSFNAFVCGEVNILDGKADIYFTNPAKNELWMKLRIFDEKGNVIAETGLIKPDEYLKTVSFDVVPENNSKIIMKIMTYEPNTYYSGGAVSLNTVAKIK